MKGFIRLLVAVFVASGLGCQAFGPVTIKLDVQLSKSMKLSMSDSNESLTFGLTEAEGGAAAATAKKKK